MRQLRAAPLRRGGRMPPCRPCYLSGTARRHCHAADSSDEPVVYRPQLLSGGHRPRAWGATPPACRHLQYGWAASASSNPVPGASNVSASRKERSAVVARRLRLLTRRLCEALRRLVVRDSATAVSAHSAGGTVPAVKKVPKGRERASGLLGPSWMVAFRRRRQGSMSASATMRA
jgi:hypothetical protein